MGMRREQPAAPVAKRVMGVAGELEGTVNLTSPGQNEAS